MARRLASGFVNWLDGLCRLEGAAKISRRSQGPWGDELRVLREMTVCVYGLFNQEKCNGH